MKSKEEILKRHLQDYWDYPSAMIPAIHEAMEEYLGNMANYCEHIVQMNTVLRNENEKLKGNNALLREINEQYEKG